MSSRTRSGATYQPKSPIPAQAKPQVLNTRAKEDKENLSPGNAAESCSKVILNSSTHTSTPQAETSMSDLPNEVMLKIMGFVPGFQRRRVVAKASKDLRQTALDPSLPPSVLSAYFLMSDYELYRVAVVDSSGNVVYENIVAPEFDYLYEYCRIQETTEYFEDEECEYVEYDTMLKFWYGQRGPDSIAYEDILKRGELQGEVCRHLDELFQPGTVLVGNSLDDIFDLVFTCQYNNWEPDVETRLRPVEHQRDIERHYRVKESALKMVIEKHAGMTVDDLDPVQLAQGMMKVYLEKEDEIEEQARLDAIRKKEEEEAHRRQYVCWECNEVGHWARDCPQTMYCDTCKKVGHIDRYCPRKIQCWTCQGYGHVARNCPRF